MRILIGILILSLWMQAEAFARFAEPPQKPIGTLPPPQAPPAPLPGTPITPNPSGDGGFSYQCQGKKGPITVRISPQPTWDIPGAPPFTNRDGTPNVNIGCNRYPNGYIKLPNGQHVPICDDWIDDRFPGFGGKNCNPSPGCAAGTGISGIGRKVIGCAVGAILDVLLDPVECGHNDEIIYPGDPRYPFEDDRGPTTISNPPVAPYPTEPEPVITLEPPVLNPDPGLSPGIIVTGGCQNGSIGPGMNLAY